MAIEMVRTSRVFGLALLSAIATGCYGGSVPRVQYDSGFGTDAALVMVDSAFADQHLAGATPSADAASEHDTSVVPANPKDAAVSGPDIPVDSAPSIDGSTATMDSNGESATSTGGPGDSGIADAPSGTGGKSGSDAAAGIGGIVASGGTVAQDAPVATGGVASSGGTSGTGGSASGGSTGSTSSTPANLYLSTSSLALGSVVVGQPSAEASFTLTNIGQQTSSPITINSNSGEFVIQTGNAGDCVSGVTTLAATVSCTVRLVFTPSVSGARSGLVTYNAASGGNGMVTVSGTGVAAANLSTGTVTLSFGTILVGSSSTVQSFTVTNTGQQASGAITVTSDNAEFAKQTGVATDCGSGINSLASNATCTVRIVFAPTAAGARSGKVSVISASGANVNVDLTGTGCAANACGGCGVLAAAPGTYCGSCKTYACSLDKTSVTCSGTDNVVKKIALGLSHTCALMSSGGLRCWGDNSYGQVGDGGTETVLYSPGDVLLPSGAPLTGVTAVSAGADATCALLEGGKVKCWGRNSMYQIGDGTTTTRFYPTDVLVSPGGSQLSGAIAIVSGMATGAHSCTLHPGGSVRCWGLNNTGQLGDGTTVNRGSPVDVLVSAGGGAFSGATGLTAGSNHTCALINGGLMCWGSNSNGRLGDGTTVQRPYPTSVAYDTPVAPGVTAASAGNSFTCSVFSGGGIDCWGWNGLGALGDGTLVDRYTPVYVRTPAASLLGVVGVSCGSNGSCGIMSGGGLKCWGGSPIGDGAWTYRTSPVDVLTAASTPITNVVSVAVSDKHACALSSAGGLSCWGINDTGQIGDGDSSRHLYATTINVCP